MKTWKKVENLTKKLKTWQKSRKLDKKVESLTKSWKLEERKKENLTKTFKLDKKLKTWQEGQDRQGIWQLTTVSTSNSSFVKCLISIYFAIAVSLTDLAIKWKQSI